MRSFWGSRTFSLPISLKVADKGAQALRRHSALPVRLEHRDSPTPSHWRFLVAGRHDHPRVEPAQSRSLEFGSALKLVPATIFADFAKFQKYRPWPAVMLHKWAGSVLTVKYVAWPCFRREESAAVNVQEFLLAQADERSAHQCAEGEYIRGVCQHAQERKNVLRLLSSH